MACLIIGDSLAVGVGQFRPECETVAKVGITSQTYLETRLPPEGMAADTVVISLGVNDGDTSGTLENLEALRASVQARAVYWLLPGLKNEVRNMIRDVAAEHGDRLIDTRPEVGRDHLHPTGSGYQRLAAQTLGDGGEVEVAFAPTEMHLPARAAKHFANRPASPRERIRRLRALRESDTSAPVVRRSMSHVPYRQRPRPLDLRVTAGVHPVAGVHGKSCPPRMRNCQLSAK